MTRSRPLSLRIRSASLAIAVALSVLPAGSAAGSVSSAYEHLWRPETMIGGDRGQTSKQVTRSELTMTLAGDEIEGTIRYEDRLGMRDASGTWSQSASIELALEGAFVQPSQTVGGTFEGEAILIRRAARTLDEAVSDAIDVRSDGIQSVYAVSGHWGGTVNGRVVAGEILFERADLMRTSVAEETPATVEWFDRAGATAPGDPQTFTVELAGEVPESGARPGDDRGAAGGGAAPALDDREPERGSGIGAVWRYIARGLRGDAAGRFVAADPKALRAARALRDARPAGATPLPSSAVTIDIDIAGAYLDALNRAAMLTADEGFAGFEPLAEEWASAREAGGPTGVPTVDGAARLAEVLTVTLAGQTAAGAEALATQAADVAERRAQAAAEEVAAWIHVARAVAAVESAGDVVVATREAAGRVRETPLPAEGPEYDAVLAAAGSARAPESALAVARFAREPSSDATAATYSPPARPAVGSGIYWISGRGRAHANPERWLAHRRGDGRLFWLAEPGGVVALTDGTLRGWAFTTDRVWIVDPKQVRRAMATYPSSIIVR